MLPLITDFSTKLATDYQELKEKQGDEKDVEDAQDLQNFGNVAADNEQGQGEADEMEYDERNRALPDWDHLIAHFSRNVPNDFESEAQNVPEFVAEETIAASRYPHKLEAPAPPERIIYELQDRLLEFQNGEHAPGPIPLQFNASMDFSNWSRCQVQEFLSQLISPQNGWLQDA
ncbi:unnamed protein product [Caenorhabditis nigoni]